MHKFKIAIDTGGTFTDCIAWDSSGKEHKLKVLSKGVLRAKILEWLDPQTVKIQNTWNLQKDILSGYTFQLLKLSHEKQLVEKFDFEKNILYLSKPLHVPPENLIPGQSFELNGNEEAPILAARIITRTGLHEQLPPLEMRLGSTRGTNALLENKGAKTALFLTQGFRDLLVIGTQQRPDIFALKIEKPAPLYHQVVEVEERRNAQGEILKPLVLPDDILLSELRENGIETIAIALMHAYKNPAHELELRDFLQSKGFKYISLSSELSPLIKYLYRAETALVNAYLEPIIKDYLQGILLKMPQNKPNLLKVMSSAGSLMSAVHFRAKDSLLSGPAGGIVGAAKIAGLSGFDRIITFDMGGTSTDVALYDKSYDYKYELHIGNAHLHTQALNIETVASGGGSLCYFDGIKLRVGPESAGSTPGPAAYGAGGDLTLTDVHILLGHLDTYSFGIPIFPEDARLKLKEIQHQIFQKTGEQLSEENILQGFLDIANEIMAGAIKKISLARGYDPKDYALLAFGGAGGLHACQIADLLQIKTILIPENAGILSAYGISQARLERFAEKQMLLALHESEHLLTEAFREIREKATDQLIREGLEASEIFISEQLVFLRFKGQELALPVNYADLEIMKRHFEAAYRNLYGHWLENRVLEIESIRVLAAEVLPENITFVENIQKNFPEKQRFLKSFVNNQWNQLPIFKVEELKPGAYTDEPAVLTGTLHSVFLEPGWSFEQDSVGTFILKKQEKSVFQKSEIITEEVALELFTHRFSFIAAQMGTMLQRTAISVNVKERLDFSCALLDNQGELIANAPHIPVHLGSLGVCVRTLRNHLPMNPGDVIITNHPKFGGSHLPDITLVSPVYTAHHELVGYVVNRAHHAEVGGIRPGSMPPQATKLIEEGVVISPQYLIKAYEPQWELIRALLSAGPYPSRAIEENLADLNAALAANRNGELALQQLVQSFGLEKVQTYMQKLKDYSTQKIKRKLDEIALHHPKIKEGITVQELLDDGTILQARLRYHQEILSIDFSGTSPTHPANLNANPAITTSVVIYVLRVLLQEDIPLNDGILKPVQILIPQHTLLNPIFPDDPAQCPAVVGGNVETSQRLTDTLLKAFEILACSQGTMNNVLFGNENFGYYETICGGGGAGEDFAGASGVHQHMTNTRITDPEILELRYPVILQKFELRQGSGGLGRFPGGEGVIREMTFLQKVALSVLSQHRVQVPYGLHGGASGVVGEQYILRKNGEKYLLSGLDKAELEAGDTFVIKTPGGGAYGRF
ncbi:MAG: hydantoinase B/oxoprolinase family protein [Microscillaceae bacterium]|nr:hydantoinase B/oxoprolinase family protein [Microscillaceae bacterium]